MQDRGIPRRVRQEKFELIREGRQWKVRAGWGFEQPRRSLTAMTRTREIRVFQQAAFVRPQFGITRFARNARCSTIGGNWRAGNPAEISPAAMSAASRQP
jgi:hypothetical protein